MVYDIRRRGYSTFVIFFQYLIKLSGGSALRPGLRLFLRPAVLVAALTSAAAAAQSAPPIDHATQFDARLLASVAQIRHWVADKARYDDGFMPTGTAVHRAYVADLEQALLGSSCVTGYRRDSFPLTYWETQRAALVRVGPQGVPLPVPITGAVPYSGQTDAAGLQAVPFLLPALTAQGTSVLLDGQAVASSIVNYPVAGKIIVFSLPLAGFDNGAVIPLLFSLNDPGHTIAPYSSRLWLSGQVLLPQVEAALRSAGARGFVAILPTKDRNVAQLYAPFNANVLGLPGLYVDADTGTALSQAVAAGEIIALRLHLQASVDAQASMDNLLATVPGNSPRTLILSSHTDGTNAVEDNGPAAILALVDYFCKIPQAERPLSLQIVMDGGHLAGNAGLKHYVQADAPALQPNLVAALEIEHLAAQDTELQDDGRYAPIGLPESLTITVSTLSKPPVDEAIAFSNQVDRSLVATRSLLNFGAGGPLTAITDVIQLITGPNYLLSHGLPRGQVLRRDIDYAAMRAQLGGLVQLILNLGNTPAEAFAVLVPDPTQPPPAPALPLHTAGIDLEGDD